jgi:pimeloyl-ACP methyl ester carboxylesterase
MRHWLTFTLALLPALAQAGEAKISREGFDLWYRTYGSGRPVLVLSGGPGLDCDYMEPVAQELAKKNQAVLVELRGTGRSRPPVVNAETVSVKTCLADLEALRDHLKAERWTVVGHSAGGTLGLFYAAAHPASVEALVLISSGHVVYEAENAVTDGDRGAAGPARSEGSVRDPPGAQGLHPRAHPALRSLPVDRAAGAVLRGRRSPSGESRALRTRPARPLPATVKVMPRDTEA